MKSLDDPLVRKVVEFLAADGLVSKVSDPGTSALHFGLVGGLDGIKSKLSDPSYNMLFSALKRGFSDLGMNINDPRIWLIVENPDLDLSKIPFFSANPLD